jgi:hypothetical protein
MHDQNNVFYAIALSALVLITWQPAGRVGVHRVRAKRGPMTGSGVTRHLSNS